MNDTIHFDIPELSSMKRYPEKLYYRGSLDLLHRPKVSIVGTRRPNPYTRSMTLELSKNVTSNKKRDCPMKNEIRGMLYGQSL